jgi:hypothetical protein
MMQAKRGRKRKENVRRSKSGKSLGECGIHPESLAIRERELKECGIVLTFEKLEGSRLVQKRTAEDALSGTTIGKLLLRWRQDKHRPDAISQEQYDAAEQWQKVVHRHAAIMGYKLNIRTPSFEIVGGSSCVAEPDEAEVRAVRARWTRCHDALTSAAREHSPRVYEVTSGIVLQDWPMSRVTQGEIGNLRLGLNAIGKVI